MSILATVVLWAWLPIVVLLFVLLPPRRAVVAAFVVGWLFLPMITFKVKGIPEYSKMSATSYGVLLSTLMFDSSRFGRFRPHLIDLPMALWCICPLFSGLSGGFGWYGGISVSLTGIIEWGLPYLIGRVYFDDLGGLRELAVGIFAGAVVYVPLIAFEARMSPQLSMWVYGLKAVNWRTYNLFGIFPWQPNVFMQNALALTMFMAAAAVTGVSLWWSGARARLFGVASGKCALAVVIGSVLCKSLGANVLMLAGVGILFTLKRFRTYAALALLLVGASAYMASRASNSWSGDLLVETAKLFASPERVESLAGRQFQENRLIARAMEQPVFGWAGWGLALMCNDVETGRPVIAVPDGLWIIVLGNNGIVGLILWSLVMMVPTLRFMWLYKAGMVHRPGVAPAAALAVVLALYMVDSLFNAMLNPIFVVCAGGLSGLGYCAVKTNGCSAPVWREVPRGGTASSVIAPVGRVTDARV